MSDSLTVIQLKKNVSQAPDAADPPQDKTLLLKPVAQAVADDKTRIQQPEHLSQNPSQKQSSASTPDVVFVSSGSIIKQRFVLQEVLGIGGMGKVYKAVDLRKQEAQDKNPYIAIKVLNDEFRAHPESLIALQREARKSQQLSHPNIVNVHDFDRDGDVVYMTMELLEGRPLDQLLAEDYPRGMPAELATPIINAVANAVLYAHQHGIVHSDLKPSNVFITRDNKAKVFDFGIARACQLSQGQLDEQLNGEKSAEKTLFDPTELGALTPTYASLEMLQGLAPEPADDIYSLACVCYELLSGKHPFKRLPADKAREQVLKAEKLPGVGKNCAAAINRGLAFERNNRFSSLEEFIQVFNNRKKNPLAYVIAILIITFIPVVLYFPQLKEQYEFSQQQPFIAQVNAADTDISALNSMTQHINSLNPSSRNYVLENIRDKWLKLVASELDRLIADTEQTQQYPEALQLLSVTQSYYADSARVAQLYDNIEKHRFSKINRLNSQFNELLETLQFTPLVANSSEQQEIEQIINGVKAIDSSHALIKDPRLLLIYQNNIEVLLSDYRITAADDLLQSAQAIFPDEVALQNLYDKLNSVKNNRQNDQLLAANSQQPMVNIAALKQKLTQLLAQSESTEQWDSDVTISYSRLNDKLGRRSTWLNEKKQTLASLYLHKSITMRDEQRLIEARRFLDKARLFNDSLYGLDDEETILQALENIQQVKHKARQRGAKIAGLKTSLSTQLKAQEMTAALRSYADLKRILGRNDPYISGAAKQAIARAYYHQARQLLLRKKYPQTIAIADSGLKFESRHSGLKNVKNKALKQQQLIKDSLLLAQQVDKQLPDSKIQPAVSKVIKPEQTIKADPCKVKFAGYGKRKRASCADRINQQIAAPLLVVLPPKNTGEPVFAISKYEITINDYNHYCRQSAECTEIKASGWLPVTGISIAQAESYVSWLSRSTHEKYTMPSSAQWLHAAKTRQTVHYNDVNCRIKFGSKLLKGQDLLAANTGQANPWGVMNIIGNAREFVVDNEQISARGGAHIDALKDCTPDMQLADIAQGDPYTGFRVVREIRSK